MTYHEFIHEIAMNIKKYLPEEFNKYDVILCCEHGQRDASLKLEKSGEPIKEISLLPFYKEYQNGANERIILRRIAVRLTENKEDDKKNNAMWILCVVAIALLFLLGKGRYRNRR